MRNTLAVFSVPYTGSMFMAGSVAGLLARGGCDVYDFLRFNLARVGPALTVIACLSVTTLTRADEPSATKNGGYINAVRGWLLKSAAGRTSGPAATGAKSSAAEAAKTPAADTAKSPTREAGGGAVAETKPPAAPTLHFQFRFEPWKDVLDWFAQKADLSLVMDQPPQGTFNYTDERGYTPAEALDILNSVLTTKGYMLIRHGRMLMLVNLEDPIPANLVPTVPVESLDTRGEFDLVSVLFNLEQLKPEEAEAEVNKLRGPQGSVVALGKSRQTLRDGHGCTLAGNPFGASTDRGTGGIVGR